MSKKICIQAGHVNIAKNSDVELRGSTGASNEAEFNKDVAEKLSLLLRENGFTVTTTDANANDNKIITDQDWDLFLAIHYDANVYSDSGGFVDYPEPKTDESTEESQRIAKVLGTEYFAFTGIKNMPKRSNKNTRYYYMWQYLSGPTPCVLIECGVGMRKPEDYKILFDDRALVIEGLARGICRAFGVVFKNPDKLADLEKQIKELRDSRNKWKKLSEEQKDQIEKLKEELKKKEELQLTNKTPLSRYETKELITELVTRIKGGALL